MSDRWSDPLYRSRVELPEAAAMRRFGGVECAVVVTDTDPGSYEAQWMPDRCVTLLITDDVSVAALRGLLPDFLAYAATLVDRPTVASLTLPSRAVDHGRVAREAGLHATNVLAVADLRHVPVRAASGRAGGITIRDAVPDDAEAVTRLYIEQAEYEARVGTLRFTTAIGEAMAREVPRTIDGECSVLVADRGRPEGAGRHGAGEVVGVVTAQPPDDSVWSGARLNLSPISYLSTASTSGAVRGAGIGTALVGELHQRLRVAGLEASVLHHSAHNPLSGPFWAQRGYRPLLTQFACPLS